MRERSAPIAYDVHKEQAKRLRAAAIDDLFRRLAALLSIHHRRRRAPALRLVSR